MNIRPYESKDKEDVRFICLNSEGPCKLSERDKNYILTTYCDYFIEKKVRIVLLPLMKTTKRWAISFVPKIMTALSSVFFLNIFHDSKNMNTVVGVQQKNQQTFSQNIKTTYPHIFISTCYPNISVRDSDIN